MTRSIYDKQELKVKIKRNIIILTTNGIFIAIRTNMASTIITKMKITSP